MTSPAFARVDLVLLYPAFVTRLELMLARFEKLGASFIGLEGFRSMAKSASVYFQGRTKPGKIITNARPGYSAHNYGLAMDFGRFFGKEYSQKPEDYEILGVEAERAGLVWGGRWHSVDLDHVQWPGYVSEFQLQPLKDIYDARTTAKLAAPNAWLFDVWSHVTHNCDTQPNLPVAGELIESNEELT